MGQRKERRKIDEEKLQKKGTEWARFFPHAHKA